MKLETSFAPINQSARTFIVTIIALGGIFTIQSAITWKGQPLLLAAYMVVAVLASMLKVQIPRIPGTFSANCLATVLAIAQLTVSDVVFLGIACALTQSLWHARVRPAALQLAFNAGVFAISGLGAGTAYSALQTFVPSIPAAISLVIAGLVFFLLNTGCISTVVGLIDRVSPLQIWRIWHIWSLPYYAFNIAIAVMITVATPASSILIVALILPLVLTPFALYHWFMRRLGPTVAHLS